MVLRYSFAYSKSDTSHACGTILIHNPWGWLQTRGDSPNSHPPSWLWTQVHRHCTCWNIHQQEGAGPKATATVCSPLLVALTCSPNLWMLFRRIFLAPFTSLPVVKSHNGQLKTLAGLSFWWTDSHAMQILLIYSSVTVTIAVSVSAAYAFNNILNE